MSDKLTDAQINREVAEIAGYRIYEYGNNCSVVGPHGLIGDIIVTPVRDPVPHFNPLHDANQAIDALERVFGHHWSIDPCPDGYYACWYRRDADVAFTSARGDTFCAAACAAIRATKGGK